MQIKSLLLLPALLLAHLSSAQNYNAGIGSGTGGVRSVHVGPNAGRISTGTANSFLGHATGYSNTNGSFNSFLGDYAGYDNTMGSYNSFVGNAAGSSNTSGSRNSFLGSFAGFSNTSGERNSFLGNEAGYSHTTGVANCYLGAFAGYSSTTAYSNSFVGAYAGYFNTTGSNNSLLGRDAGYANTTGSFNSLVGYQSGYRNTTGYNNSFLGNRSGYANTSGYNNSFVGYEAGKANTTGSGNAFMGFGAGSVNTTGSGLTLIGNLANSSVNNLTNATAIGNRARVSASNALILGSINGQNGATASTRVGIGTTAPGYRLHLNASDAAKVGGGSWVVASDKRLKKDIAQFSDGLNVLLQIKPVTFRYNGKAGIDTEEKQFVGVIAQEMQKIAPYTVGQFTYQDSTGKTENYLDYDPNAVTYVLVNATKELKAENDALRNTVSELEARLARLEVLLLKQTDTKAASARLFQNQPNPYNRTTTIKYFLPQTVNSAQLKIFSVTGQEVFSQELTQKGESQVQLLESAFPAGSYIYHLTVDGQSVDSKKMVLNR